MQALPIEQDIPLQQFNTFGIPARARRYLRVTEPAQLALLAADPALAALPRLVLGGGSNLLITREDIDLLVLHMALMGKDIVGETPDSILVRARAGENWHGFVQWTLEQGLGGLENMSLIPGTVGASPIQNIGAYGAEVKDLFHSLTAFDFATGLTRSMDAAACRFAYRDSVFKHEEGRGLAVLDVTFALPKAWTANLRYAELAQALQAEGLAGPTPRQVSAAVVAIRRRKLPDPLEIGNAGSFFKNPVVSSEHCARLLERWPALVHHRQPDGSEKLAAGWLIDQCGWKGKNRGRAGVYPKQALVLVNNGGASGEEVLALARAIQADVRERFGVELEPEPVMI
ncbi:UDP-N-acetylenolpyruvoylglucosamine reductase [Massilia sp. WF1]|uniref:UDP-N-acetylmuramate dehydrogenase n=1 Tax=unclassified Massilia TaxID=2609279 RepID=UPI00064B1629|nr:MULTISPECIES: UDP-N-acetylmuramate dehydrogenase [unclassified Massilia]ALK96415.1 UDP-N-acetylenolpyruvoylglucosamine reductase [Massilia sp. WG5]KLU37831.1 UDP-N-acetylenolpyruvoylglucosamine reductase [Massilia sp. WF1]